MFRHVLAFLCLPLVFFACSAAATAGSPPVREGGRADLVVYGGTASGVITAYSAAREGMHVILLEPGHHLGGMVTGGLSASDVANFRVIGGYARDFYRQAAAHYGRSALEVHSDWLSEPHVGEEIFQRMLADSMVNVRFGERLKEHTGVTRSGTRIVSIQTEDGSRWQAKVFADCSYEGDLMAQAGVRHTWGCESSAEYGEDLAGVRSALYVFLPMQRPHRAPPFSAPFAEKGGTAHPSPSHQQSES
jgi:alkyl hydroperoxide reductase subunit AhpF